ncbi:hypothetical protein CDD83_1702 [Cordyceps sp. RAO-2017]|nr:hypothetical protein CDD83_1702 [Cordyceps sp. RAO-2017]
MAYRLIKGYFYPEATLARTYTEACEKSLADFKASVIRRYGQEAWKDYFNADERGEAAVAVPLRLIPNLTSYLYRLTCLKDSGRWCNIVAATAAMAQDPGSSRFSWGSVVANETTKPPSECDICFIKRLRMEASSPYFKGPRLSSLSVYQSLTSKCSVTNIPPTTSTLGFSTPVATPPAAPSYTGDNYRIRPGDDCYSISRFQRVGTAWLLADNRLGAYCASFPESGSLYIVNKCSVYTVKANDTCNGIARGHNITMPQLKLWNPIIDAGYYNLVKISGTALCVSVPGRPYTLPSSVVTGIPGAPTTPAPVPGDIANGTTSRCARYHIVKPGEYCNGLVIKYGISQRHFSILNPSVNTNCTNLYAHESYCVAAPGYSSAATTATTQPSTAFSLLPDSSMTPYPRNDTRLPLAEHTRNDCARYFNGSLFSDVKLPNVYAMAASIFHADLDALGIWNPSLGNTSRANYTFDTTRRYCGQLYYNADDEPTRKPATFELPKRARHVKECTRFNDMPDGWTYQDVFDYYRLTAAEFYRLNPAVGPDCSNLWTTHIQSPAQYDSHGAGADAYGPGVQLQQVERGHQRRQLLGHG